MASEFYPNRIKNICDIYGEENILGFVIDSNSRFVLSEGQRFSYDKNVDIPSDCLVMEARANGCVSYDDNLTLFTYIPIMMIHSVLIRKERGSDKQYDIMTIGF